MKFAKFFAVATIAAVSFSAQADQEVGNQLAMCSGVFATVSKIHKDNGGAQADIRDNARLSSAFVKTAATHIGANRAADGGARMYEGLMNAFRANNPQVAGDVKAYMRECAELGAAAGVGRFLK